MLDPPVSFGTQKVTNDIIGHYLSIGRVTAMVSP